ncbi:hypothetical protein JCM8208_007642 [Rhodotorula glutinis]
MATHSLFFYGTLCHAAVLARVIGNPGDHLTTTDALLVDHARLHVDGEDYPAVVRSRDAAQVLGRALTDDERSVRGVLVQGLTDDDVALLDEFEGDEYMRAPCTVDPLPSSSPSSLPSSTSAAVYLWTAPLKRLSPSIWTFEQFLRDSAHRWVGPGADANPEFAEVDRRRDMRGVITPKGVRESTEAALADAVDEKLRVEGDGDGGESAAVAAKHEYEPFGRSLRAKYFSHEPGWTPLNHGSYGAAPLPVLSRVAALQAQCAASADRFNKVEYEPLLVEARTRVADFVGCDTGDVVFVTNATMGVNTVLRGLTTEWREGDRLMYFSTSIYNACERTLQYIVDTHPRLSLSLLPIPLSYPLSHAALLDQVAAALDAANNDGTGRRVRLALIDAISAAPAVCVPYPALVALLRARGILSLVDAAHELGQLPHISLRDSEPDFWVSNVHKWGFATRTCAVLYVAKRWQHVVHSIPIGASYTRREKSDEGDERWTREFNWSGTVDWSPILSVPAALDFRRDVLGGEQRIYDYCHALALEGGQLVAEMLGTEVLRNESDEDGELTACMVNIALPLPPPSYYTPSSLAALSSFWIARLTTAHTFAPVYTHNDRFWTRLSAQVYVELDDFCVGAQVLRDVCDEIRRGDFERT